LYRQHFEIENTEIYPPYYSITPMPVSDPSIHYPSYLSPFLLHKKLCLLQLLLVVATCAMPLSIEELTFVSVAILIELDTWAVKLPFVIKLAEKGGA
jgi:hypothetical protein